MDPQQLVGVGIRAYAFGNFYNAKAAFGRATQLLVKKHGDEHDSLGEVYIHYAKSLLKLSYEEVEESSSEDDTDEEDGSSNGSTENEEDKNLQRAGEVLEVAKRIFTNRGDSGKEQFAETLILLGEVTFRRTNFQNGINDVKAGIDMQKVLFESTSWKQLKLAESFCKLGIVHSIVSNIDEAVECFKNSIEILKNRIKFLKERKEEKTCEKINNKYDEIEKMGSFIPEIEEKIFQQEMTVKLLQEMAESAGSAKNKEKTPSKQEAASSSKPNDISHQVKRKREADDDSGEGDGKPSKKFAVL